MSGVPGLEGNPGVEGLLVPLLDDEPLELELLPGEPVPVLELPCTPKCE
jgi:hypothetical protein